VPEANWLCFRYTPTDKSDSSGLKEFDLFFGSMLHLMQHTIHGIQVSTGASFDDICARAFTGNQPATSEIAFQIDFAQGIFAARDCSDMILHQVPSLVENAIDGLHGGIDGPVSW
jgi:hypothetical protein